MLVQYDETRRVQGSEGGSGVGASHSLFVCGHLPILIYLCTLHVLSEGRTASLTHVW